jgi:hypothetical protein
MAASSDGTVGAATIDEAIHRQRVSGRRRELYSRCQSRLSPLSRGRPLERGCRWLWPATCALWPAPPS